MTLENPHDDLSEKGRNVTLHPCQKLEQILGARIAVSDFQIPIFSEPCVDVKKVQRLARGSMVGHQEHSGVIIHVVEYLADAIIHRLVDFSDQMFVFLETAFVIRACCVSKFPEPVNRGICDVMNHHEKITQNKLNK